MHNNCYNVMGFSYVSVKYIVRSMKCNHLILPHPKSKISLLLKFAKLILRITKVYNMSFIRAD